MLIYILLVFSLLLIFIIKNRNRNYWTKRNVKQVDGEGWKFLLGKRSLPEIYKDIYTKHDDQQIGILVGSTPGLILKNLDDIKAVFAGDFQSFHSRGISTNDNDLLADNILFTNDIQRWKILRQKLSPVFTTMRLKTMFGIIEKCARDFIKLVENNKEIRQKPYDALYTFTTASIGAAVLSIDTNSTNNLMDSPFLNMSAKVAQPTFKTKLSFFLANSFPAIYKRLKLKIFGDHEEFFIGAVKKVFESRQNSTKLYDFIDVCLDLKKNGTMKDFISGYELEPTDELLAAQAFFFFIAGADTSATVMQFAFLELSSNPKVLAKVHNEIDSVLYGKEKITFQDLDKLQYLDMVINESMRKYPSIGFLQRICTKDTVLPSNNLKIEKDTIMIIPTFAIHRDEKYYPNAELFNPERFVGDNINYINKYSYLPFGEGNRICIGEL